MPLPPSAGFPAPTTFPAPTPDDMLGATPEELRTMADAGLSTGLATPTGFGSATDAASSSSMLEMLSGVTGGAVGAANDPTAWTPQEAADQSNTAIAKIATVNPDLAAQLQAQRTGEPDTGGGFFDTLKGAVAGVIGLPGVKQVLDYISRPAQIIPEIFGDREGDSVWENINQAMSGNSDANWHRVLTDKFGIDGPLGAVLGFVGDVATDPTTYLMAGLGGIGKEAALRVAGEAGFKSTFEEAGTQAAGVAERWAAELSAKAGREVTKDEALKIMYRNVTSPGEVFARQGTSAVEKLGADDVLSMTEFVHRDAAGGVIGVALRDGEQQLILNGMDVADKALSFASRGGTFAGRGSLGQKLGEELGIDGALVDDVLTRTRQAGLFADKELYMAGKVAAGVQGGIRFKFSLPVFNLRYVSPAIPGSERLGFGFSRRFFTGMSGESRLQKLVEREVPKASDALATFWNPLEGQGGYSAVKRQYGDVARQMSKGHFGLGGFLYSASEQAGRLTAHFSPNAMMMRGGGLGSQMVRDFNVASKDYESRFGGDAWNLADETDPEKMRASDDVQAEIARVLAGADEARQAQFHNYAATGEAGDLTPEEVKALDDLAKVRDNATRMANEVGASPVDPVNDIDSAEHLHPDDAGGFTQGTHDEVAHREWHIVGDSQGEDAAHVDAGLARTHESGRGIVLEEGPGGAGSAVARVRNVLWVDSREGTQNLTPSVSPLGDYEKGARTAVDQIGAGTEGLTEPLHLSEAAKAEKRATLVSQAAKADGYDAIGYIDADGTHRIVVLDQSNVKRVTPDASRLSRGRSIPHILTQEAKESMRGVKGADDLKYVGGQAKWEVELEKQLVGKTHEEAEAIVRKTLEGKGATLGESRVLELDPVKLTSQYVQRTGKQAVNSMQGRFARKLENMGFGGALDLGGVSDRSYRWAPTDVLDQVDDEIRKSRSKLDSIVAGHDGVKERQWRAHQAAQRLARSADLADQELRDAEQGLERVIAGGPAPATYDASLGEVGTIDDDYAYHITDEQAFEPIADEGLRTYSPRADGSPTWHDGGTDERSFWLDQPPTPVEGKNRLLRKRYDSGGLRKEDGTMNLYDNGHTPVEDLEYLGSDGTWHPLSDRSPRLRTAGLDVGGAPKRIVTLDEMDELVRRQKLASGVAVKARQKAADRAALVQKFQDQLDREARYIHDGLAEHNKLIAEQHLRAANAMPALRTNKGDLAGFAELKIPGLEGHYMPAYMAVEMNQAARGMKSLAGFHLQYRRFMGAWKTWATWMNPGFHIRNMQGAWFNNMLGGVGFKEHAMAFRTRKAATEMATLDSNVWNWAKKKVDPSEVRKMGLDFQFGGQPVTYGDLARLTSEVGINRANTNIFGEAMQGAEQVDKAAGRKHIIERGPESKWHPGQRYVKAARTAGDLTENLFRTAAWIQGMKTTGGDMMGARAFTMMRHGDYSDLTDWESGFVRDLIPFYKWMRTNTPYQIHQLLENPGKLTAVLHARDAAWGAQGLNFKEEMQKLPPWMQDTFSVPLPGARSGAMKLLTLDLPMSDLYKGTKEYLSSFLPLAKPFFENYVTHQSTFTGAPITKDAIPVEPWLGDLPVVRDIVSAVGLGEVNKEGQLTMNAETQNLLSIIPVFSRFRDWMFGDPERAKYRVNTAASAFFGVGLRPIDEETATDNELGFYYQNIIPEMERMKSLGWTLPSKEDLQQAGVIADTMTQGTVPVAGTDLLDALSQQSV